ncbi:MAG: hypothetical protein L0154_04630 [Chloroflexi bacterium]|nr:hypothetical protein [Chloroflexota bacterium]
MTVNTKKTSSVVSLFIGLAVLLFVLLLALFMLKIAVQLVFGLAPLVGIVMAIYGGWRYYEGTTDAQKLRAMYYVAGGLTLAFLGALF